MFKDHPNLTVLLIHIILTWTSQNQKEMKNI